MNSDKYTSGNFVLYMEAINIIENMKLNLIKSIEIFWTNVNQNIARIDQSSEKEISDEKKSIRDLIRKILGNLLGYELKGEKEELEILIYNLDEEIDKLSNLLGQYFKISGWHRRLMSISHQ